MPIRYNSLLASLLPEDAIDIASLSDAELGLEPEEVIPEFEPQEFQTSGVGRFLEGFGGGIQRQRPPRVRNFGQGLAAGFIGGLGSAGSRIGERRQKFEAQQEKQRAAVDTRRMESAKERRAARGKAMSELSKEQRDTIRKQREYERDNPLVTEKMHADFPATARIPVGQRLDEATWKEVQKRSLPESPAEARAAAAANRQVAAAERAAVAGERQAVTAASQVEGRLVDDYAKDPSITAYRQAQQNLATMKSASKEPSGFGDLAMLIAYVRATEPGVLSVVRQEELQNVSQAVGQLQRYMNIPSQWVSGKRLTADGRKAILRAGEKIASSQKPAYEKSRKIFSSRAKRANVPEDIFQEFTPDERPPLSSFGTP